MTTIPTTQGAPQASDLAVENALGVAGTVSRTDLQTVLTTNDSLFQALYEDRSAMFVGGGIINYNALGTTLTFGERLDFTYNNAGAQETITSIVAASGTMSFASNGNMAYITVTKGSPGSATLTVNATTLPAATTTQEVFLYAIRRDDVSNVKRIYFKGGNSIEAGQNISPGQVTTFSDTEFAIFDAADATKLFEFNISNQNTGTVYTFDTPVATASKTLILPNPTASSDTIPSRTTTDTFTNKSMSGSSNTFTSIPLTSAVTGLLPYANGGTNVTTPVTAPTASTYAGWDANSNLSANNLIEGYATTATAGATTTLTVSSAYDQYFTGILTQTVKLPATSTLVTGQAWTIVNRSTGAVTVTASDASTVQVLASNSTVTVTCISTGITSSSAWSAAYAPLQGSGTVQSVALTVPNVFSVSGSPITTTGTLAVSYSGTPLPILNGGTGVTTVTTTPTASTFAAWDANSNLSANNHLNGYATTTTAAGTTTLVVGSAQQQYFTGSSTQTVKLPVTATLSLGQSFEIVNLSTGTVTVQSSGANSIATLIGGQTVDFVCILTSGTTAASWQVLPRISSSGVPGNTTGIAVAGGFVGEQKTGTMSNTGSLTTGLITNNGSITLTPGIWAVSGLLSISWGSAPTFTYIQAAITSTTSTVGSFPTIFTAPGNVVNPGVPTPIAFFNVSTNTPVYLNLQVGFTGGSAVIGNGSQSTMVATRIA